MCWSSIEQSWLKIEKPWVQILPPPNVLLKKNMFIVNALRKTTEDKKIANLLC